MPLLITAWLTPVFMQLGALTFPVAWTFVAFSYMRSSTIPFSVPYSLAFIFAWAFILLTITPKGSATPALGKPFIKGLRNSQLFYCLSFIDLYKKLSCSVKGVMWMNAHKWWFQTEEGKKIKGLTFKNFYCSMGKNYAQNQGCTLASNPHSLVTRFWGVSLLLSGVSWWIQERDLKVFKCPKTCGGAWRKLQTCFHLSCTQILGIQSLKIHLEMSMGGTPLSFLLCSTETHGHEKWLRFKLGWVTPERCWPFLPKIPQILITKRMISSPSLPLCAFISSPQMAVCSGRNYLWLSIFKWHKA